MNVPQIDQVMVRRVGGWIMVDVDWWLIQSDERRAELLADEAVRFISDGESLDVVATAAALAATTTAPAPALVVVEWPPLDGTPAPCAYARTVVEGPRWEVLRIDAMGDASPFAAVMGRTGNDPYDLSTNAGRENLSEDLLSDALASTTPVSQVIGSHGFAHFVRRTFATRLGNRKWEITDDGLRKLLRENPYVDLRMAASA